MNTGFDTLDVSLIHQPDGQCRVPEPGNQFWYRGHQFRSRPGAIVNGMSSPQFTHVCKLLEAYGWTLPATEKHDCGYGDDLEQWIEPEVLGDIGRWKPFTFTKEECDIMLKELLDVLAGADGVKQNLALVIYEAVRHAGQPAFDAARQTKSGLNAGGQR